MIPRMLVALVAFIVLLANGANSSAQPVEPKSGENVSWAGTIGDDIFSAGKTIDVDATVAGDAFLAGGDIRVAGDLKDSVYAAGGQLKLNGAVADDLIAAGGSVETGGHVGDNLVVAGGSVDVSSDVGGRVIASGGKVWLDRSAVVHKDAWLSGGSVEIDGDVAGGGRFAGKAIIIRGHVAGNVTARGGVVKLLAGARIDGNLDVYSPNKAEIDPTAMVGGTVNHHATEGMANWASALARIAIFSMIVVYFYLFVVGLLMVLICPGFVGRNREILADQSFVTLGVGALIVLATPPVAGFLAITIIGIPFAIAALLLFVVTMMISIPAFGTALAHRLADRSTADISRGRVLLFYVLVLVVLWGIGLIPILGGLVWLIASMLGVGLLAIQIFPLFKRMRGGVQPA